MKKLILLSNELALTDEERDCFNDNKKRGFYPSDSWYDEHTMLITREFPNNMFKKIKSREELYKFLRNRCNIDFISEILEVPESLEALNIDERFVDAFNDRVGEEKAAEAGKIAHRIKDKTGKFTTQECTKEELQNIIENGMTNQNYFHSVSTKEEYKEELRKIVFKERT